MDDPASPFGRVTRFSVGLWAGRSAAAGNRDPRAAGVERWVKARNCPIVVGTKCLYVGKLRNGGQRLGQDLSKVASPLKAPDAVDFEQLEVLHRRREWCERRGQADDADGGVVEDIVAR